MQKKGPYGTSKAKPAETNIAPGAETSSGLTHNPNSPYHSGGNKERKLSDKNRKSGQGCNDLSGGNQDNWGDYAHNQNQSRQGSEGWKPGSRVASIKTYSPGRNQNDDWGNQDRENNWDQQNNTGSCWNTGANPEGTIWDSRENQGGNDAWNSGTNQGGDGWNFGGNQGGNKWNSGNTNNYQYNWNNNDNNAWDTTDNNEGGLTREFLSKNGHGSTRGSPQKTSPIPSTPSNNIGVTNGASPAGSTATVRRRNVSGEPPPPKPPSDNIAGRAGSHAGSNGGGYGKGAGNGHKNGKDKMPGSWESNDERTETQKEAHAESQPWADPTAAQSTQAWPNEWGGNAK
jgi:hypothetical protein